MTLVETSFLSDLSGQAGSFLMATLEFEGVTPGSGTISIVTDAFTELVVSDLGGPPTFTIEPFNTPISEVSVLITPEPATAGLVAAGLLALAGRRRRH